MDEWVTKIKARIAAIAEKGLAAKRPKTQRASTTKSKKNKPKAPRKPATAKTRKRQTKTPQEKLEQKRERERRYYAANKARFAVRRKARLKERRKDPEFLKKAADYRAKWVKENPEKARSYWTKSRQKNKERYADLRRKNYKHRWDNDPVYNTVVRCRNRTADIFRRKNEVKSKRTKELLGCSGEDFKAHIEAQFIDGMSWENRDRWHLDHIVPLSIAESKFEVELLCHYTNVRPLWEKENRKKSSKLPSPSIMKRTRPNRQQTT